MKGLGTDEDTLIEIIASRDEERLNQIKLKICLIFLMIADL